MTAGKKTEEEQNVPAPGADGERLQRVAFFFPL